VAARRIQENSSNSEQVIHEQCRQRLSQAFLQLAIAADLTGNQCTAIKANNQANQLKLRTLHGISEESVRTMDLPFGILCPQKKL
jgi:hypothetical protein